MTEKCNAITNNPYVTFACEKKCNQHKNQTYDLQREVSVDPEV